jgi:hypothetical protein
MAKKNQTAPDTSEPGDIKLTPKQRTKLSEIESKGIALKIQIADITEKIIVAQRQRDKMFEELYKVGTEYGAEVNKFASQLGIDVDADPKVTGERFDFQPSTGTFVRIPVLPEGQPA